MFCSIFVHNLNVHFMNLPSKILMQDKENPNLIWITETTGGKQIVSTQETTETVVATDTVEVNANQQIITETITRTVVKKKLSTLNNTTTE